MDARPNDRIYFSPGLNEWTLSSVRSITEQQWVEVFAKYCGFNLPECKIHVRHRYQSSIHSSVTVQAGERIVYVNVVPPSLSSGHPPVRIRGDCN